MTRETYQAIEEVMLSHMRDSAHDSQHIYRVLRAALEIAKGHPEADRDILIAACLLHDIGRGEQLKDPSVSHAQAGADMAEACLLEMGWSPARARRVADAVRTHRYRGGARPQTIEGKILYDADKLDVAGAIGVARTLLYQGEIKEPLYRVDARGEPMDGGEDRPSFANEYVHKLAGIYDGFYTREGEAAARPRAEAARSFYESLLREAKGGAALSDLLAEVLA